MSKCECVTDDGQALVDYFSRAPNLQSTKQVLGASLVPGCRNSQPMEARTRAPYVFMSHAAARVASRVCSSQVVRFCGRDAADAARPYVRHTSVFPVTARRTFPQLRKSKRMADWRWVWCCCQKATATASLPFSRRRERLSSCGVSLPNARYIS